MAIGDVTNIGPNAKAIELLASSTATNSPPAGASAGLEVNTIYSAFGRVPDTMSLRVWSTAGSGTMSATFRLWGYDPLVADWMPVGTGAAATKGVINEGGALDETAADELRHTELVDFVGHFSRVYLEITAISGTATAVKAALVGAV